MFMRGWLFVEFGGVSWRVGRWWVPDGLHVWWRDRGVSVYWRRGRLDRRRVIFSRAPLPAIADAIADADLERGAWCDAAR
jgi:hypothetical protein